jgi:hypothetical protein
MQSALSLSGTPKFFCRSRLAGDGVRKFAARVDGLIASKPAPTGGPCLQRSSLGAPQNFVGAGLLAMASASSPQCLKASSPASWLLRGSCLQRSRFGALQNLVGAGLPAMASASSPQCLKASSPASWLLRGSCLQRSRFGAPQKQCRSRLAAGGVPTMASVTAPQKLSVDNAGLVI